MTANPFSLEGKAAIVTGANTGLGQGMAVALAEAGADLALVGRSSPDETVELVRKAGRKAHVIMADLGSLDPVDTIVGETKEALGGLDILVNNAGNVIFENIEDCSLEHFKLHLDIHVVGTFLGCKYALPLMKHRHKENGGGGSSIINMASTAALMGYAAIPAYTAAKGGISAMTRSIAMHCQDEGYGIRCNALAPGGIETPMVRSVSGRDGEELLDIPSGPLAADALGDPQDVAGCVLFLASDDARFLNGLTIPVDNGLDARPHH